MIKRNGNGMNAFAKETLEKFKETARPIIEKLQDIVAKLKNTEKYVALVTHVNPDPDATASILALKRYFLKNDVKVEFLADEIMRESKVIVNKIGIKIRPLAELVNDKYGAVILVDAASLNQSNINTGYVRIEPALVIDHHDDEAPYASTSTIITLLMNVLGFELSSDVATALYEGIDVDTNSFTSDKFTEFDDLAFRMLSPLVDISLRKEIVQSSYSENYLIMLETTIHNRFRQGSMVISGAGYIDSKQQTDLARIANFLLRFEGVERVVVIAIADKEWIMPVIRSSTGIENAGELSKKVFGDATAGGDPIKAGGRVKLDSVLSKLIERAMANHDDRSLKEYFDTILEFYKEKVLKEQTE